MAKVLSSVSEFNVTKVGLELGAEAVYVELTQAMIAEVVGQQVLDLARSSLNSLALEQANMVVNQARVTTARSLTQLLPSTGRASPTGIVESSQENLDKAYFMNSGSMRSRVFSAKNTDVYKEWIHSIEV